MWWSGIRRIELKGADALSYVMLYAAYIMMDSTAVNIHHQLDSYLLTPYVSFLLILQAILHGYMEA
jgi:hypothetical protein